MKIRLALAAVLAAVMPIIGAVTVSAAAEYTVTYDYRRTASKTEEAAVEADGSVTLPMAERAGYSFDGWYTAVSGGERVGGSGESYTPTSSTTLYAGWTPLIGFESEPASGCYCDNGTLYGAVAFNFRINAEGGLAERITTLGINIYGEGENPESDGSDTEFNIADRNVMSYDGWFHFVVDKIKAEDFDKTLYAMPYVVVDGEVVAADAPSGARVDIGRVIENGVGNEVL